MSIEQGVTRRDFLIAVGSAVLAATCKDIPVPESATSKEGEENVPKMGDIIVTGNKAELLRNGMRYHVRDLPTYLRRSENPGKRFEDPEVARMIRQRYPEGKVDLSKPIDIVQGDLKRINSDGGQKLVISQGFLSSDSRPYGQIKPREDAFVALRRRLKSEGWDPDPGDPTLKDILFLDSYIFTYKEDKELKTYGIEDTLKDPNVNNGYATEFIKKRVEQNPFDQYNGLGHSLGGLYILRMAMEYPDAFNNLILLNSPIRGILSNPVTLAQAQILKEALKPFGLDSRKVTDYLFSLWEDKDYQKKLKKFVSDFVKSGRKFVVVYTEGDIIVSKESAVVEGAQVKSISAGRVNPLNPIEVFTAHGLALWHEDVLTLSSKTIGKNLSTS